MRWWQAETQARQAGSFRGCGLAQITAPVLLAGGDCNTGQAGCPPKKQTPGLQRRAGGTEGEGHAEEWGQRRSSLVVASGKGRGLVLSQAPHTAIDHRGTTCPAVGAWGGNMPGLQNAGPGKNSSIGF